MIETFRIKTSLDEFERIVLLYKDETNNVFIGHSFYYGGRDGSEYLLFLYKEPLPKKDLLAGWNALDETSCYITIVGVHDHRIAVEDFLVCHNPQLTWEDVIYIPTEDFMEMNQIYSQLDLKAGCAYAFVIRKNA
ncbi:hypothetical protein [Holdemania massiliensis]|uniref:hypothetical protein n=1 Tax=Holdemania massiliensis TaxID=1468449 RepID=UPI001F061553|nr:hypothetical protein [Holdemania massiliensis]MCH1939098.1 hypothetical protein [Holdemania massiliensis]